MLNKFKDYKFLMAFLGAVILLVQNVALLFGVRVNDDILLNIINAIGGTLLILGVVTKTDNDNEINTLDFEEDDDDDTDSQTITHTDIDTDTQYDILTNDEIDDTNITDKKDN